MGTARPSAAMAADSKCALPCSTMRCAEDLAASRPSRTCRGRPAVRRQRHELVPGVAAALPRGAIRVDDAGRSGVCRMTDSSMLSSTNASSAGWARSRDLGRRRTRRAAVREFELARRRGVRPKRPRRLASELDDLLARAGWRSRRASGPQRGLDAGPRARDPTATIRRLPRDRSDDPAQYSEGLVVMFPRSSLLRAQHWPSACDARPLPSSASAGHPLGGRVIARFRWVELSTDAGETAAPRRGTLRRQRSPSGPELEPTETHAGPSARHCSRCAPFVAVGRVPAHVDALRGHPAGHQAAARQRAAFVAGNAVFRFAWGRGAVRGHPAAVRPRGRRREPVRAGDQCRRRSGRCSSRSPCAQWRQRESSRGAGARRVLELLERTPPWLAFVLGLRVLRSSGSAVALPAGRARRRAGPRTDLWQRELAWLVAIVFVLEVMLLAPLVIYVAGARASRRAARALPGVA